MRSGPRGSGEALRSHRASRAASALPNRAARVIIGAGPAGCAAAIGLARGGTSPLQFDRSSGAAPPRLCGEFLSGEAVRGLAALGIDARALGGRPTRHLRLACGERRIDAELPFEALGLTRHTLDAALQAGAFAAGVQLHRGRRVTLVRSSRGGTPFVLRVDEAGYAGDRQAAGPVPLPLDLADTVTAPTLLLATGKTDLAPLARRPRAPADAMVGFQMHLQLAPEQARALIGRVEVILLEGEHSGGYAGLQPVEGGRVNLCLLARRSPRHPGLPELMASLRRDSSLLAERLQGAKLVEGPPQSIARVPYGYLHRSTTADPPGLWRLGDQAAVIPSFTGDGVAIALHSGALAAACLLQGDDPASYHRMLSAQLGAQMQRARALLGIGRSALGRRAVFALLGQRPALAGFIAAMTRVPPAALRW